jgi:hypothetical protein
MPAGQGEPHLEGFDGDPSAARKRLIEFAKLATERLDAKTVNGLAYYIAVHLDVLVLQAKTRDGQFFADKVKASLELERQNKSAPGGIQ